MTWVAFGVGVFVGVIFTLLTLSVLYVCSRDARHEERVAKYLYAERTNRA